MTLLKNIAAEKTDIFKDDIENDITQSGHLD